MNASNIAMEEDKRDEASKKSTVDLVQLSADIAVQVELAKQVSGAT